jgi:tectonin beta-propeller repeat-containing protein 1
MILSMLFQETYENQRWNPMDGFSNRLLPTDRPHFSTIDGLHEKSKESIHLPTMAWQWETPWYVDSQFNGTNLDKEVTLIDSASS